MSKAKRERETMLLEVHGRLVEQFLGEMAKYRKLRRTKAIDVGCGGCIVFRDCLGRRFQKTDLNDCDEESVKMAQDMRKMWGDRVGKITNVSITEWFGERTYDLVNMRYVLGYMDDT